MNGAERTTVRIAPEDVAVYEFGIAAARPAAIWAAVSVDLTGV